MTSIVNRDTRNKSYLADSSLLCKRDFNLCLECNLIKHRHAKLILQLNIKNSYNTPFNTNITKYSTLKFFLIVL